ncbi:nucleotidyltransferase domain-containing protein [Sulfurihydrogenibium sp.]|uniref:nucleotidyltransferase family protein n=1 Tax=Sulfurihydrogenibium sp. TaxID=2053621 RepID=UPI0026362518|nr:nucleotidyltransferase domain-containing protein [Sulfurihydrogenibium sp.]
MEKSEVYERSIGKILDYIKQNFRDKKIEVILFGSRARGDYKYYSDIDLAIKGLGKKEILKIKDFVEESTIPYFVDIVRYEDAPLKLRENIEREGVTIWKN